MSDNSEKPETIGERINFARDVYCWNQTELSEMIEVTRAAVSQYEKDMIRPRAEILDRLARVFNTDPEWFLFGRGRPPRAVETPVIIPEIDLELLTPRVKDLRTLRLGCDVGLRKSWFDAGARTDQTVTFVAPNTAAPVEAGDHVVVDLSRRRPGRGVFLVYRRPQDGKGAGECRLAPHGGHHNGLDTLGRVIAYYRAI
jgi:transcriptional regulator with XRE-family HTH domain